MKWNTTLNWEDIQLRQHVYGEGMLDIFKSFGSKLFRKTVKKAAKKGAENAVTAAVTKTGEHVGKEAADKLVKMLSKTVKLQKKLFLMKLLNQFQRK